MQRTLMLRLVVCTAAAATLIVSQAVAQQQREHDSYDSYDFDDSSVQPAQFSAGGGFGGGYGGGGAGFDLLDHGCTGQFYVGGEYLYVRANYSQAISYVTRDITDALNPRLIFNQFDFDYNSSYRFYGGYRLCECGGDIRFTYSKFDSDAAFQSPTVATNLGQTFFAPLEVNADLAGTSLNGRARVELNAYDIEFGKTIPLGCLCCDSGCDDGCCDDGCCGDDCCGDCDSGCCGSGGCGGCCCPAWDISWRGGVRIADVDQEFVYDNTIPQNTALEQTSRVRQTFEGAGLRWGMTGRRYIGRRGIGSIYIKGDLSLLLGDQTIIAEGVAGTAFARHEISCTHIIPVTEIEAGATVNVTDNVTLSGGYLFSAWHDLGYRVEYPYSTQPTGVQIDAYDDANILGFDGFFARAEVAF